MGHTIPNFKESPILTEVFQGYLPPDASFIREKVLPKVKVTSKTGKIAKASVEPLRVHTDIVVGEGKPHRVYFKWETADRWDVENHQLEMLITRSDALDAGGGAGESFGRKILRNRGTKGLKKTLMIARERGLSSTITNVSVITNNLTLTGSDRWDDYVNSDPVSDVLTGKITVRSAVGYEPNTGICSYDVFEWLRNHPRLKFTNGVAPDGTVGTRRLSEAEVAKALGLDRLLVGRAMYSTAKFGAARVLADIWPKDFVVAYINSGAVIDETDDSLGYIYTLQDAKINMINNNANVTGSELIRTDEWFDEVVAQADSAYLLKTVVN